jgi:hypothetical protein
MGPANGHANGAGVSQSSQTSEPLALLDVPEMPATSPPTSQKVQELFKELAVPFDLAVVEWRVTNTMKDKPRGQVIPYADQRAYTDRLNLLVTPAGWTRKYAIHTSANFQRGNDRRIVAKIFVTCELTIFGLGSHSATGEDWADDDNACTSAEAQAFKRACSCFGLGRYLYHFSGVWVDLDERKRPRNIPRLFGWATPQGWRQGLRPGQEANATLSNSFENRNGFSESAANGQRERSEEVNTIVGQIEAMANALGRRLYRGVLKSVAGVWNPIEIQEVDVLRKVLEHMHAGERGLRRLECALNRVGPEAVVPVLRCLRLNSLKQVDSLESLKKVVLAAEEDAGLTH